MILILPYIYTGIEQLSNWILDVGSKTSQCGIIDKKGEEAKISHVGID